MKNLLKITSILGIMLMLTSCLVDDSMASDNNGDSPNFIGFIDTSALIGGIADGTEYDNELWMRMQGPTWEEMSSDVSATISVDPSSTAVEGTHFRLDNKTITLTSANNYGAKLPITLLTDGIMAPLDVSPVVVLNISDAQGANVVNSGKKIAITLNYLCPSDLSGTYSVEMRFVRALDGTDAMYTGVDVINETGVGEYRTEAVGHWEIAGGPGAIGGTAGFDFVDVCDQLTIPSQNLVELYSNLVQGVSGASFVNPDTGVITFEYTVCASDCREYFCTYTPL